MTHTALDIRPRSRDNKSLELMTTQRNLSRCGTSQTHFTMSASWSLRCSRSVSMPGASLCSVYVQPQPSQPKVLFLRKQLALYEERQVKPRRATNAIRLAMVWLSCWFDWRSALRIVKPETFTRWHRQGFRLFWRWKSHPGRPALPKDLRALIRRMALENPTWGQERIANELLLKLGLRVSPRTVRKYMPRHCVGSPGKRRQSQRWSTFIRNHAKGISRATSAWRSLRPFVCSMCLW